MYTHYFVRNFIFITLLSVVPIMAMEQTDNSQKQEGDENKELNNEQQLQWIEADTQTLEGRRATLEVIVNELQSIKKDIQEKNPAVTEKNLNSFSITLANAQRCLSMLNEEHTPDSITKIDEFLSDYVSNKSNSMQLGQFLMHPEKAESQKRKYSFGVDVSKKLKKLKTTNSFISSQYALLQQEQLNENPSLKTLHNFLQELNCYSMIIFQHSAKSFTKVIKNSIKDMRNRIKKEITNLESARDLLQGAETQFSSEEAAAIINDYPTFKENILQDSVECTKHSIEDFYTSLSDILEKKDSSDSE